MPNKTEKCCTCGCAIVDSNRGPVFTQNVGMRKPVTWCLPCWEAWLVKYEADQAAEAERLRKQILDFVGKLA